MKNRDGGINPNLVAWNAYVGYQFNENSSLRLDARNLLNRHNVISNGDWEYWDEPFNYQLSYTQKILDYYKSVLELYKEYHHEQEHCAFSYV